jgi:UDP-N-acetyl-2-amino-2-deoxyglucuronate dehydrogenase
MKRFGLIGAAGYIAPRHARAIVDVGGELVCACDTSDSVGFLDSVARDCAFTCNPAEFFEDYLERFSVDTVAVCTPNFLHATHARSALDAGANVILEKPLCVRGSGLNSAEGLIAAVRGLPRRIFPVVQLRHHPAILALRNEVKSTREFYHCDIDYQTYRGDWYGKSWKGREPESGGLLVNLGVHLFDLCLYCFGPFLHASKTTIGERSAEGMFRTERATIKWRLSIEDGEARRVFSVAGNEIDVSNRMAELHREVYLQAMKNHAWDLDDVAMSLHAIDRIKAQASA